MNPQKILTIIKKVLILSFVFLFSSQISVAQKSNAEIERFVRDFAKAYENVTKSRDVETS